MMPPRAPIPLSDGESLGPVTKDRARPQPSWSGDALMATEDAETMITRAPMNYSASADGHAEFWSPVIRPLGRRLLEALPWDRAGRILDVGTGTGALIPDMVHLAPAARIVGIDPSLGMLDRATGVWALPVAMDAMALGVRAGRSTSPCWPSSSSTFPIQRRPWRR